MIRYALQTGDSRAGEFEFLSDGQCNWTPSLKTARKEKESRIYEHMHSQFPPMTRSEALDELQGVKILKLTIEEVT